MQTSPICTQYARNNACAKRLICRCAWWYDQIKCLTCHDDRSPSLSLLFSPGIPRNSRAAAALSGSRCAGSRAQPPWLEQLSPVLTHTHTYARHTHTEEGQRAAGWCYCLGNDTPSLGERWMAHWISVINLVTDTHSGAQHTHAQTRESQYGIWDYIMTRRHP